MEKIGKTVAEKDGYTVRELLICDENGNNCVVGRYRLFDPYGNLIGTYSSSDEALDNIPPSHKI